MVKSINYIIKADKTRHLASLAVMLFAQIYKLSVLCKLMEFRFYKGKLVNTKYDRSKSRPNFEYYLILRNNKIYSLNSRKAKVSTQKTITGSCKINDQLKSLTKIIGGHSVCQIYTMPNRQHSSKAINSLLKLDRSTLGKCRYTSLELAMRSPALIAAAIANFWIDNLVKVVSHVHNQEQYL
ncbi:hypothetical protein [Nostoc sp. PCC 7107]|uniref:hypothetical protein n=1 Tax=Nostoc sp. PCC 7107 TaxID=317936 RepID=UPI00029ED4C3|nr:hypothetical protein [Nostoc sp. PCC 7107]AFY45074.1 hypothetical protein Nos7107_4544 [Nostoc sp. PCC 7107]